MLDSDLASLEEFQLLYANHDELQEVVVQLKRLKIIPYLVGGAVREFLLFSKLGNDFDFELHCKEDDNSVPQLLELLHVNLSNSKLAGDFEFLRFNVLRFSTSSAVYEFSFARTEAFENSTVGLGHDEFSCSFFLDLPVLNSFSRRDFTINAIAIVFTPEGLSLVDPFEGVEDLKRQKLRQCGSGFFYDPVRFLRLLRFQNRLGFTVDEVILEKLGTFQLSKLSSYYLLSEAFKSSRPQQFLTIFFSYCDEYDLTIPPVLKLFRSWGNIPDVYNIKNAQEMFFCSLMLHKYGDEEIFSLAAAVQVKKKVAKFALRVKADPLLLTEPTFIGKYEQLCSILSQFSKKEF